MSSTDTSTLHDASETGERAGMLERPLSRVLRPEAEGSRLRGRPDLYTAYKQDMALLNTPAKRNATLILLVAVVWGAFVLPSDIVVIGATAFALAIGAIGMNLVTGYAGQVSLGHAFFVGIGIYTAAIISGDPEARVLGYGIEFAPLWLLAAGLAAAFFGAIVAPLALRLKGLYLAIVTLGLVFLGDHIFREATTLTGGFGVGRPAAVVNFGFGRFDVDGEILGVYLSKNQRLYLLILVILVVLAIVGRNIARSDVGRAFSAIRDRDVAAEVIGVNLTRGKVLAFVISSFYAGVCGALLFTIAGFVEPSSLSLILSVRFLAMILVGGVATISGSIMGAVFIATLPRISFEIAQSVPSSLGLNENIVEGVLSGLLIVVFLIVEPRGLFGLWLRIRNYWKAWPFSY
jgi:branched-chain amino acid transport system permease protein